MALMTLTDLTPRQREVIELIAEGYQAPAIAQRLGLTERTVYFHVSRIRESIGDGSVGFVELVRHFYQFTAKHTDASEITDCTPKQ